MNDRTLILGAGMTGLAAGLASGRPVIEGKQIEPFRVAIADSRLALREAVDCDRRVPRRARLAYRDVASAGNRLTLIAAIVPARAVTTHTLFCLRTPLPLPHQRVLCALLNSYVANYLVRRWVTTHVTTSLVARLPVPLVRRGDGLFERLQSASAALSAGEDPGASVAVQVAAAEAYRVTPEVLDHILATFPLVPTGERAAIAARSVSGMRP